MQMVSMNRPRSSLPFLAVGLAAVLLSGCAMSDDNLARVVVAPGKFSLYTCPELVTKGKALARRARELERLMAKAGPDAGGGLVSAIAYRPDYVQVRGEMRDVREAAADKHCDISAADAAGSAVKRPSRR